MGIKQRNLFWLNKEIETTPQSSFVIDIFSNFTEYISLVIEHLKEIPFGYGERPFVGYLAQTAYKSGKYWVLVEYDMNLKKLPDGDKGWYRPDLYLADMTTQSTCTFEVKTDWIREQKTNQVASFSALIERKMQCARERLHKYSEKCPWKESDFWCSLVVVRLCCTREDVKRWEQQPNSYPVKLSQIDKACKDSLTTQNYTYKPSFYYRYFLDFEEVSNKRLWSDKKPPPFGLFCVGRLESYRQIRR